MNSDMDNLRFEDPELKKALNRALPKVLVPEALRLKLERELGELSTAPDLPLTQPSNPWHISTWFTSHRRLAIAASIAGLGLGIGLFFASSSFNQPTPAGGTSLVAADPVIVEGALVRHDEMHQSLARGRDQLRQSLLSVPEAREQVRREVALPVPFVDLSSQGWQFAGAKPCRMGTCCGVQLFYTRNQQTMSVFVFPAGRISPEAVAACSTNNDYRTAIRPLPDATLFVVGRCPSGKLSQTEIEQVASLFAH